ncbi:MAG: polyisoprenoid-binding protein [Opitutus sp.]|nr:polyisoprenoid-binding protein [Opitutus sp.]
MNIRPSLFALAALAAGFAATASAAVETYVADPAHSSVNFNIRHFFTKVPGRFTKFTAAITVDRDHLEKSNAEATIHVASVSTTEEKRDAHLQQAEFFDAAQFPTMTFKSKAWQQTGADRFDVTGALTIKGVTKDVVLKVKSLGFGPGMMGAMLSGWEGSVTIQRADFGVSAFAGVVGADVEITINLEAKLTK